MGWWDDLTWGVSRAFNTYKTLYEKPEVRKEVAGRVLDAVESKGVGDALADGLQAGVFISGRNPSDVPKLTLDIIRGAGNAADFAVSQLPGAGALNASIKSAAELAAGREPVHLADLATETGLSFAPKGVGEVISAVRGVTDLPALSSLLKHETKPASASLVKKEEQVIIPKPVPQSLPKPIPAVPRLPRPAPEPLPPNVVPRIAPVVLRAEMFDTLLPDSSRRDPFSLARPRPLKKRRKA
jgi:hypothetical protein